MAVYFYLPAVSLSLSGPSIASSQDVVNLTKADSFYDELLNKYNTVRTRARLGEARFLGRNSDLSGITAADEFYVFGHGNYRGDEKATHPMPLLATKWKGGATESELGPETLAALLREKRLPDLAGLVVHIFACNSGVRNPRDGRSFAKRMAMHMGVCGYGAVKVGGYVGVVSLGSGSQPMVHKEVDLTNAANPVQSNSKPASEREVIYNTSGFIASGHEGTATRSRTFFGRDVLRIRNV